MTPTVRLVRCEGRPTPGTTGKFRVEDVADGRPLGYILRTPGLGPDAGWWHRVAGAHGTSYVANRTRADAVDAILRAHGREVPVR